VGLASLTSYRFTLPTLRLLWLEHVVETKNPTGKEYYWLMWYDKGHPTIPMSGVFEKSELENMLKGLANFVP